MFMMAVGHSDDVDLNDALDEAIDECRVNLGGRKPTAGLLFAGYDAFDPSMPGAVLAAFPGIALAGSTSYAEMSSAGGYTEDGLTLALFAADEVDVFAGAAARVDTDVEAACRMAVDQVMNRVDKTPRLAIMLADGLAAQSALDAVRGLLPDGVVLVGGASSGPNLAAIRPNYQFADGHVVQNGVALLLLCGPLEFSVAVGTGLRPIGPTGVVTGSGPGVITEIDGRRASAFIEPYISEAGPAAFGNPLAFHDTEMSEWYLRAMLGADQATGAITIPGTVPTGAKVQLTTASTDEIVRATGEVVRRAIRQFPGGAEPAAALLFSCAVRKFMLGTRTAQEIVEASSLLPPGLPIAGMYCGAEIAPVAGDNESKFHNETFVTLLLGGA
jgi:hypothetical protein